MNMLWITNNDLVIQNLIVVEVSNSSTSLHFLSCSRNLTRDDPYHIDQKEFINIGDVRYLSQDIIRITSIAQNLGKMALKKWAI
jgi:hypothetical protein